MRFSVIIPVYNCKVFLVDTVEQVRNAGLWDYEILLIDDGSTDGCAALCDALVKNHAEIRCIHQTNAGVSAARNRGMAESRGEYILFFDADDGVDPGALRNAAQILLQKRPDMLIFGMSFDYYFHGRLYRREELVYPRTTMLNKQQLASTMVDLYRCNALSPVWNKFIRRDLLITNCVQFEGSLIEMEDFVFSMNSLQHCESVFVLSEVIYRYRQAENERNTYNRLCRIDSLTGYMDPFWECIENLIRDIGADETARKMMRSLVGSIYLIFFRERIRFASPGEIGTAAQDMLAGSFSGLVEREDPNLFRNLKAGRHYSVWLEYFCRRMRHWIAVRVKYLRSLGRK